MRRKDESGADAGLARYALRTRIYHYTFNILPFTAITIATQQFSRDSGRQKIDAALTILRNYRTQHATRMRNLLRKEEIYGVSICDCRNEFSARRGRTIAKGRLLKYLRQRERREERKKEEHKVNAGLIKCLHTTLYIHHYIFSKDYPFAAITIATPRLSRPAGQQKINGALATLRMGEPAPAARILDKLREEGVYGVNIRDHHDKYSQQRSEAIAKKRLLDYFTQIESEEKNE